MADNLVPKVFNKDLQSLAKVLILDTYSRLDSTLVFQYTTDRQAERFAEKYNIRAPMSLSVSGDEIGSYYYFPETIENERESMIFLKQFEATKKNGTWTLYFSGSEHEDLLSLERFLEIPSLIIDSMKLDGSMHQFSMRFNSEYTRNVSMLLMDLISEGSEFDVFNFGDNTGIDSYLSSFSESEFSKLSFVRILTKDDSSAEYEGFRIPDGTIREFKMNNGPHTVKANYYFPEDPGQKLPEKFKKVSEKHNIYEGPAESELFYFLSLYDDGIPLHSISRIQKFTEDGIVTEILAPKWAVEILLKRLSEARKVFPNAELMVEYVSRIDEENIRNS